jgi:SAM-dependent methyltransferase
VNPSHRRVASIFNEMQHDYDDLRDLWYAWLFSRLHLIIARDVIRNWSATPKVLDVGCGTGLQSFLYSWGGGDVVGVDVAADLIAVARRKREIFRAGQPLFPVHFPFVARHHRKLEDILKSCHPGPLPDFQEADAIALPFADAIFDHVGCCGSVLSLIDEFGTAIQEISRVLRPGGTFVFEVEAKYSPDLLWPVVDLLLGGRLHYNCSWAEAFVPILSPPTQPVCVEFPYGEPSSPIFMDLHLFSKTGLKHELLKSGLRPNKWHSIHSVTNLLPSTWLDTVPPSTALEKAFSLLSGFEERCPFFLPGTSLVVCGVKVPSPQDE